MIFSYAIVNYCIIDKILMNLISINNKNFFCDFMNQKKLYEYFENCFITK